MSDQKIDLILKEVKTMNQDLQTVTHELLGVKQAQQLTIQELDGVKQAQQMTTQELDGVKQELGSTKQAQQMMTQELDGVKQAQQMTTQEMQDMRQVQQVMKEDYLDMNARMNHRFDTLESKVDKTQLDVSDIKKTTERIDQSVHDDVVAMLKIVESRAHENKDDTTVLNNRLFQVESTVQNMTRR